MNNTLAIRKDYLNRTFTALWENAKNGYFHPKRAPFEIKVAQAIPGPRAGALLMNAGDNTSYIRKALVADDYNLARQIIAWNFEGSPAVYFDGRDLRLEAAWPENLAEKDIPLSTIGANPKSGGRWIAGKTEEGKTITLGLDDSTPHFLVAGWTGSGKTYALRSAVAQLAREEANHLILIDLKYGEGLGQLERLPGVIGPVAKDVETAKRALSFAVNDMRQRYERKEAGRPVAGRLIVVVDEVQELTGRNGDPAATEMIRMLVSKGRGANVHLLVGTQHPTKDALDDSQIKRNLVGRIALRVEDGKASEVVVGGREPRADRLAGAGDCYAITPSRIVRTQLAYMPNSELTRWLVSAPRLEEWPEFDAGAAGTLPAEDSPRWNYTGDELALAIEAAYLGTGRPKLQAMFEKAGYTRPGSVKAERLMKLGRDAYERLVKDRYWLTRYDG